MLERQHTVAGYLRNLQQREEMDQAKRAIMVTTIAIEQRQTRERSWKRAILLRRSQYKKRQIMPSCLTLCRACLPCHQRGHYLPLFVLAPAQEYRSLP